MKINVLSGDSLVEPFKKTKIEGEIIVCRECFIDGDLQAGSLDEFWKVRDNYLSNSFSKPDNFYVEKVKAEFDKLLANAKGSEINLWFEYELFCQVNFWFCLSILKDIDAELFIVYPFLKDEKDIWKGFGWLDKNDLQQSFEQRIKLNSDDILLGAKLWKAFQSKDYVELEKLSRTDSKGFPTLKVVCEAACEIETRPKETLEKIIENGANDFGKAFQAFNEIEAIYGFGDLQVKKIYDYIQK